MNQEERILEFDKIKKIWMEYAFTEKAKQMIEATKPILSELELRTRLRETSESKQLLEICGNPPLVSLEGLEEVMGIAAKGDCLTANQLEQIKSFLVAVSRLSSYLEKGKNYKNTLAYYEENLDTLESLKEEICEAIWNGQVAENASARLQQLRRDIKRSEEKMQQKAEQVIRGNKECMSDSFSTMRNGHICIPVKKEYKFRIAGSVIDKSATGNTLFIEPAAAGKYYEELQQLRIDEEDEVRRILYGLTVLVDSVAESIQENIRIMEKLDFVFSKGKLSLQYDGVEPGIIEERVIRLIDARHPLLDKETCVPLQFELGEDVRGVVITGPNTGGKTVAIKTVALCCMMAQCGLHVPCKSAEVCMCSNILCDIGDGQNLSENLSTFSAHITNVLDILKKVNKDSLVIMDELGSGTDPQEGMGIAVAILDELKKSEALFLVTTHYPEIKNYAEKEEGILNARMAFDAKNLKPLYQMVIGEAGESCALHIAKRLGMPTNMLRRAMEAAYGAPKQEMQAVNDTPQYATGVRYDSQRQELLNDAVSTLQKEVTPRLVRSKPTHIKKENSFRRGDSVMIYPDRKIGIVCTEANDKGTLQVQLQGKKIWINYKRLKLLVVATELYPENYDFSIVFDTVENRKIRHEMDRKYTKREIRLEE